MDGDCRQAKRRIWWNYILSQKSVIKIYLCHIAISVLFINAMTFLHKKINLPEFTLTDISNDISMWVKQFLVDETHTGNMINPFSTIACATTVSGAILMIIKFFINMSKEGYDASFMNQSDQKKKNLLRLLMGALFFFIAFFIFIATNFFNVIFEVQPYARPLFIVASVLLILLFIVHSIRVLDDNGRSDILQYLASLYIVLLLILYPVKEGSLLWAFIYMVFMISMAISIMHRCETKAINDTAVYYFEVDDRKLYIHYRLDDERVVCSDNALLKQDSQRILYSISDLCGEKVLKDISNFDKNWKETIAQIKEIREKEPAEKEKKKAERKAQKALKKRVKQEARIRRKEERSKIRALKSEIAEWKEKYRDSQSKIDDLLKEIDELKNENKGA